MLLLLLLHTVCTDALYNTKSHHTIIQAISLSPCVCFSLKSHEMSYWMDERVVRKRKENRCIHSIWIVVFSFHFVFESFGAATMAWVGMRKRCAARQNRIADITSCCLLNDLIPIDWQFRIDNRHTPVCFSRRWFLLRLHFFSSACLIERSAFLHPSVNRLSVLPRILFYFFPLFNFIWNFHEKKFGKSIFSLSFDNPSYYRIFSHWF